MTLSQSTLYKLQYPIGEFSPPQNVSKDQIEEWIESIEKLPSRLKRLTENISDEELATPYRPEGWTIRQVIHHIPDSHLNCYIRFKWTLTEPGPIIKPYFEKKWANLADYAGPINIPINLLEAIHAKWVYLLKSMTTDQWDRYFIHPENNEKVLLKNAVGSYAWHGNHHYAHVASTIQKLRND